MAAELPVTMRPTVSVIVPARNEQACLATCLESLAAQEGLSFEIIVVDDHSTDRTREIASSFSGVQVIEADPLRAGWTGKNNALATGVRQSKGEWLLFTDADTMHLRRSLPRALREAQENMADLLSYSPEQIVNGFCERAVMPVIFAELAYAYSPTEVSDPKTAKAAANGQYILIKREAYDAVGGHAAIAGELLEDVALARAVKQSGRRIRFRYGGDAVRTRMYHSFQQLREGWTKNLALLFPRPVWLASWIVAFWAISWTLFFATMAGMVRREWWIAYGALPLIFLFFRIAKAKFGKVTTCITAAFGPPVFAYLLLRSKRAHSRGQVSWKGRTYRDSSIESSKSISQKHANLLTTEN
ncbi:MAG TPA: glycosyltransferase [Candidatus Sulfotelmatobacter sp.]|nr:glycosyltransferase [Candidatus Sulfotelmatobacter sp.]